MVTMVTRLLAAMANVPGRMFQAGQYHVLHLGCWGDQEDRVCY